MIEVQSADLRGAMKSVKAFMPGNPTIPILSHVLLRSEKGAATFTASDSNVIGAQTIPATIKKKVAAAIPAGLLAAFADGATGAVTIAEDDGRMLLKSGRSRARIPFLPAEDWPDIRHDGGDEVDNPASLAIAVDFCSPVMGRDDMKPSVMGVHIGNGRVAATDVKQMHAIPFACDADALIPSMYVHTFSDVARRSGAKVFIGSTFWRAEAEDFSCSGKLMEAQFPNFVERLNETPWTQALTVNREEFSGAIKAATLGRGDWIVVTANDDGAKVECHGRGEKGGFDGEASAELDGEVASGECDIRLSARRTMASLAAMSGAQVDIATSDDGSMIRISPAGSSMGEVACMSTVRF